MQNRDDAFIADNEQIENTADSADDEQIENTADSADNLVELVDLEVAFEGVEVLNVSYVAFERNKRYFVKGESGTGKTTLFNVISGLVVADKGVVMVDGKYVNLMSESQRDVFRANYVGYIFQDFNLFDGFTALENVLVALTFTGNKMKASEAKNVALNALLKVGLKDKANTKVNKMSGGEKQRVAIARAVVNMPKLLLADEPTGNLDRKNSVLIMDLLLKLAKENGCTLLVISHDLSFSSKFDQSLDIYDFNVVKEG